MIQRLFFTMLLLSFGHVAALAEPETPDSSEIAILAGGCFWCIEADYEKLDGIVDVVSGYTGGHVAKPSYEQVSAGGTGHIESVRIVYDSDRISYAEILDYFWRHIDPTRDDGQFCDHGPQYRPAIFYRNEEQHRQALASQQRVERIKPFDEPLKVEITAAGEFYPAENYHQDYYRKNPLRYKFYRFNCGRDARVEQLWGASR
jgi:peptide-methionine (S)-S-oxide reductase